MRRRTQNFFDDLDFKISFNTRLREEANFCFWITTEESVWFQYTPPWGGELLYPALYASESFVSIHASVRRRTNQKFSQMLTISSFNTRLREEANFAGMCSLMEWALFQYTPPWGGEHSSFLKKFATPLFQYTPPWGGEPVLSFNLNVEIAVSIHASVRRRT